MAEKAKVLFLLRILSKDYVIIINDNSDAVPLEKALNDNFLSLTVAKKQYQRK